MTIQPDSHSDMRLSTLYASAIGGRSPWIEWAGLLLIGCLVLVFLDFQDFGLTHDEEVQANYGEMLLNWYKSGFADQSALTYLDLFRYGGLFDLTAALVAKISPYGLYETRHLMGGLWWVLGLCGVWTLGRMAGGDRAGFLSMLILALTPAFMGHGFNNPKDAPFAVAMIWSVWAIARFMLDLHHANANRCSIRWSSIFYLGISFGAALSIRVGAVLLIAYLGLCLMVYAAVILHCHGWVAVRRQIWPVARSLTVALGLAYGFMAVFWPWGVQDPLNPIRAMQHFSRYDIDIVSLFAGTKVDATDLPALYLSDYIIVTIPEMALIGLMGLAVGVHRPWNRYRENRAVLAIIALAFFFPMVFFIAFRPTAYDGLRHFLFVLPPLALLSGLGLERIWNACESFSARLGHGFAICLLIGTVTQGWIMARLHPNEYIYYNLLAGGVAGASGQWEMDYWSNSVHETVDQLNRFVLMENDGAAPEEPAKIIVCGNSLSATYYFPPWFQLVNNISEADFMIAFTQADCWKTWRGKPVAIVDRFGVTLSLAKDRRGLSDPEKE